MKSFTEQRPWGSFVRFLTEPASPVVKLLYVNKGESLSLQFHHKREEFWRVISGHPEITIQESVFSAEPNQEFVIEKEARHRISAPHDDIVILEISTGEFDENDIVRLEDKYNRNV
jgi:mannose-6-phosphate isomerase-like protein (cupin superfamily)